MLLLDKPSRFADPADTIKAQQQVQGVSAIHSHSGSTLAAFQQVSCRPCVDISSRTCMLCSCATSVQVAKSEGLFGFYRGFGAVLSGVVPATALYFGGYESGKRLMPAGYGILGGMLVGCYTQAIAGIVFTPVDIIKERMQVRYCPTCTTLCAVDAPEPYMPCCTCCRVHQGSIQTLPLHPSKGFDQVDQAGNIWHVIC